MAPTGRLLPNSSARRRAAAHAADRPGGKSMSHIRTVKCTSVLAQVNLGFYDVVGNLVGEETFPQVDGNVAAARLFHPHPEQLGSLVDLCVQQAWEKLRASGQAEEPQRHEEHRGNSKEEVLAGR